MKLKKWQAEAEATPEEISLLVESAVQELKNSAPGDWTMNIDPAAGILVLGVIESNGNTEIFQCRIEQSNVDAAMQIIEGELAKMPKQVLA